MALEKNDLTKIRKVIREEIDSTEIKLTKKIDETKKETIDILGLEISDLTDISRAAFVKMDQFEYRLRIVERKLKIGTR